VYNADPRFRQLIDSLTVRDANGNIIESGLAVFNRLASAMNACLNNTPVGTNCSSPPGIDQYVRTSDIITQQINLRVAGIYNPALDPLSPLYGVYDLVKLPGTDAQFPGGLFAGGDGIVYNADAFAVGRVVTVNGGQLSGFQRFGYAALGTFEIVLGGLSGAGAVAVAPTCPVTGVGCVVTGALGYGAFAGVDEGATNVRRAWEGNSNFSTLGAATIQLANNSLGGTATTADAQRYYSYSQLVAGGVTLGYGGVQVGRYVAGRYVTAQEAAINSRLVANQAAINAFNPSFQAASRSALVVHLEDAVVVKNAISGGHNAVNFNATLAANQGVILSSRDLAPGIREVTYRLSGASRDSIKTIYDPVLYSQVPSLAPTVAREALASFAVNRQASQVVVVNGIRFNAIISPRFNLPRVVTFYPIGVVR
jgi:hypothetical protein